VAAGKSDQLFIKWFGILDRHWRLFLLLPLLFTFILASGMAFLKQNSDGRIFFDKNSPERQRLLALEQRFSESNSILLVLSAQDGSIFTPKSMQAILTVTKLAWRIPYVTRVTSLSNFQHVSSNDDGLVINDLFTADSLRDPGLIAKVKAYALSDKDLVGQIISPDGATTAIALNVAAPRGDSDTIQTIMTKVEKIKDVIHKKYSGLGFYITGDVPLDNAFAQAYGYDLQYLFPLFLLVIFLVCAFFFRSLLLSAVILLMMLLVVAATMGSSGYLGIDLTAGTSSVPVILITISLADFIHLLSVTRRGMRAGLDEKRAVEQAIRRTFLPVFLTSITTLIGFVSLNFSDAPPFRDLGNLVAIGILISYLISLTFFPVLLARMKLGHIFRTEPGRFALSANFIPAFSEYLVSKRKNIFLAITLVTIVIGSGVTKIEFDDDWVKYFDRGNQFRQDTEFVINHLTGVETIEYVISSGKEGGITAPAFLNRLDKFDKWALGQPEINHVSSIVSLFKKMNFYMNRKAGETSEHSATIAKNANLNAQYLLLYEMSLPAGQDLNDRIDIAREDTRLTVTARNLSSRQMRQLDARVSKKLRQMKLISPHDSGTGVPLMFANLSARNIKSMLAGIAFALITVSLIITLSFRSLKLGLISFVVNILPIILGFGIWGWIYHYVGVSLTVVAAIAFGLVVDDTIHFITKYSENTGKKHRNVVNALAATYSEIGGALLMTSCVLALGFMVLTFSLFQPTWALGLISVIMILLALVYDFLLLPVLLALSDIGLKRKSG